MRNRRCQPGGRRRLCLGNPIGAIIVGVINNGMTLLNVSSYFQEFVIGLVIVISVLIDVQKTEKQGNRPGRLKFKNPKKRRNENEENDCTVTCAVTGI